MKVAVFSTKSYDREFLASLEERHDLTYVEARLDGDGSARGRL